MSDVAEEQVVLAFAKAWRTVWSRMVFWHCLHREHGTRRNGYSKNWLVRPLFQTIGGARCTQYALVASMTRIRVFG
jgi:hypothetical protein